METCAEEQSGRARQGLSWHAWLWAVGDPRWCFGRFLYGDVCLEKLSDIQTLFCSWIYYDLLYGTIWVCIKIGRILRDPLKEGK